MKKMSKYVLLACVSLIGMTLAGANVDAATAGEITTCNKLANGSVPVTNSNIKATVNTIIENDGNEANLNCLDTTAVTSMDQLFYDNVEFNGDISLWNTSNVESMYFTFANTESFNGDLSKWDVSNVTNMEAMFTNSGFNGDISSWNTSSVTNMKSMFQNNDFDGDISLWDTSKVTHMGYMFATNPKFNQDISGWDVSNVTNMNVMFGNATSFNQDLSSWDTSKVLKFDGMFQYSNMNTKNVDNILNSWNVEQATVEAMFEGLAYSLLSQDKVISEMNSTLEEGTLVLKNTSIENGVIFNPMDNLVSATVPSGYELNNSYFTMTNDVDTTVEGDYHVNVKSIFMNESASALVSVKAPIVEIISCMSGNTYTANSNEELKELVVSIIGNDGINADLNCINTTNVSDMTSIFEGMTDFNGDISNWDMTNVVTTSRMFYDATSFNGKLPAMPSVVDASFMFYGATSFNHALPKMPSLFNGESMFQNATSFDQRLNIIKKSSRMSRAVDVYNVTNAITNTDMSIENVDYILEQAATYQGEVEGLEGFLDGLEYTNVVAYEAIVANNPGVDLGGVVVETPVTNPDGSVTNPDGSVTNPDGTITNPDGSVTNPDGTVTNPDGTVTSPDGTNTDGVVSQTMATTGPRVYETGLVFNIGSVLVLLIAAFILKRKVTVK